MQIWIDHARPGSHVDRLLNGPTHNVWITPWRKYLEGLGVRFEFGARATRVKLQDGRIAGVRLSTPAGVREIAADYYLAAIPVERMAALASEALREADPALAQLDHLHTEWMNGIQFFLDREMRAIHQNVLRSGMYGIPVGGCAGLVRALADFIVERGGDIRTGVEVMRIVADERAARVQGVEFRDRHSRETFAIQAPVVVSDAGPAATRQLLNGAGQRAIGDLEQVNQAAGLKLHIVSDRSLIPHNGIVLCLDTRRISGMVEVSRALPSVVPAGFHMIDTFQVMRSESLTEERDLAIADLRDIFGCDFDRHCRIVRTSAFRSRWPVNHAKQGDDLRDQEPIPGLLMVGDAYKPTGHIMAEGVAAGVQRIAPRLPRGRGKQRRVEWRQTPGLSGRTLDDAVHVPDRVYVGVAGSSD